MRIRGTDRARWRQVPVGMRDLTAGQVAARRRFEARLLDLFARWGYVEVATPMVEYLETLLHGAGPGIGDRLLKLVDTGGEVLTLRPEMTVPLARLAATRLLPADPRPLRLAYAAPVFRGQERGSGLAREFTQAGVELIGDGTLFADAEVIALACEALRAAAVGDPVISVGHTGFLRGLLAALPERTAEDVRDLLYSRAFADLESVLRPGPEIAALRLLPTLRGREALARARSLATSEESRDALGVLDAVIEHVAQHRGAARVEVDLALIRDFDYYSGTIFEGHAARARMPLLGGGRYDGLLARFGQAAPATGFAIGVEHVLETPRPTERLLPVVGVVFERHAYGTAVRVAASLRDAGMHAVTVSVDAPPPATACVVAITGGAMVVRHGGRERAVGLDDLVSIVRSVLEAS